MIHRTAIALAALPALMLAGTALAATAYQAPEAFARPGFASIQAWGINDAGSIVGSSDDVGYVYANGGFTSVVHPLANAGTIVTGIAQGGTMVGLYFVDNGNDDFATFSFVLDNGSFAPFALPNTTTTMVRAISPDGRYLSGMADTDTDSLGFVFDRSNNTTTWLAMAGSFQTIAQGVNRHGIVVGNHVLAASMRPSFVHDVTNGQETLVYDVAGLPNPRLRAINDAGTIGGFVSAGNAVIGTLAGGWYVFDKPSGVDIMSVYGVNSAGVAVGWSTFESVDGTQSWIARPVPEPGTWALLLLGGAAVLGAATRRRAAEPVAEH